MLPVIFTPSGWASLLAASDSNARCKLLPYVFLDTAIPFAVIWQKIISHYPTRSNWDTTIEASRVLVGRYRRGDTSVTIERTSFRAPRYCIQLSKILVIWPIHCFDTHLRLSTICPPPESPVKRK